MLRKLLLGLLLVPSASIYAFEFDYTHVECGASKYKANQVYDRYDSKTMGDDFEIYDIAMSGRADGLEDGTIRYSHSTGKPATAALSYHNDILETRYYFNTQNGGLEVTDLITGFSSNSTWYKLSYDFTGYLQAYSQLTNLKGGLLGDPQVFRVEVGCVARR